MADTSPNGLKRPRPNGEQQDLAKKIRANDGSPAPSSVNGQSKKENMDISKVIADFRAKAAAMGARAQGSTPTASTGSPSPALPVENTGSGLSKIEMMKARIAAATSKAATNSQRNTAPGTPSYPVPTFDDGFSRARGGLDVGLHPALMGDSQQDPRSSKSRQTIQPKFATTMANRRPASPATFPKSKNQLDLSGPSAEETRNNPYFDPSLGPQTATLKSRQPKQLIFNQKGKYIQQAIALRRQAALEAMKKRIAESSRKAGIDEDLDTEKAFLVPAPPDIEWWDEGLVQDANYDSIDFSSGLKIDTPDSIITVYIQHPVALEPPQDKNLPPPKPMFLTAKEQAKLRRQRRMADLKETQAKIRLGLEPAPPPKVKKSNLMRVLGEEAVKDPTAVEARVNREIAERAQKHEQMNQDRKLTKEQAHEKLAEKQTKDAAKGIFVACFKIDSLANGRHRFKISKNAEQYALTGVCILNPKFSLVIVEGGAHSITAYKKLMLNRIDWTENSGPNMVREGNKEVLARWLQAEEENGILKDLGLNRCVLLWEGEGKGRSFRKWGNSRICETEAAVREVLARAKMESFWTLAKTLKE